MWLTKRTLAWFASQDSPDQFKQITLERARRAYDKYLTTDQISIQGLGKILYELTLTQYYYLEHHLHPFRFDPVEHRLVPHCQDDLYRYINGPFLDVLQSFGASVETLAACRKTGFKHRLCYAIKERFFVDKCILDLNVPGLCQPKSRTGYNAGMMVVANGVLDFHRMSKDDFFRPGKPENYLTQRAPVQYRSDYTPDHPDVIRCHAWLDQIVSAENKLKLFRSVSRLLRGTQEDPPAYFWYGPSACGKSSLQWLIERALGPYALRIRAEGCRNGRKERLRSVRADHIRILFCAIESEDELPEWYPGRAIFVTCVPPTQTIVPERYIITFDPPACKDEQTPTPEALLWLIIHTSDDHP
jgi:hypothetical protein